jgi:hypothetical protein
VPAATGRRSPSGAPRRARWLRLAVGLVAFDDDVGAAVEPSTLVLTRTETVPRTVRDVVTVPTTVSVTETVTTTETVTVPTTVTVTVTEPPPEPVR